MIKFYENTYINLKGDYMLELYNELITKIDKTRVLLNEPMTKHTTFKIGGLADIFVKIETKEELKNSLEIAKKNNIPITVIGNGSNVLVMDKGIRGIVIKLDLKDIRIDNNLIYVEAGVLLPKLARVACDNNLTGLEEIAGIPGTFGGAIYMNSGAHGIEISDKIISITYIDENLEIKTINKEDADFSYRKSIFQNENWIILNGTLRLENGNQEEIKEKMQDFLETRKQNQPLNMPSAGSVFKRGDNYISAKLIDKCGLKGKSIGGAQVSEKHAGFIVNNGNATAKDVLELIDFIKQQVDDKSGVELKTEIKILGEA